MDPRSQSLLLRKIQELSFVAVDLNLFLDTHPGDRRALEMYNNVHRDLMQAVRKYEQVYGPLVNFGYSPVMQDSWTWVESPWPWEIKY